MKVPMVDLKREYEYMKDDIDGAIQRCLEHQQWILGPEVEEFENKIAEYLGVKHCIGVSSGTDALVLALRALAIKTKGQEYFDRSDLIITTPFTFTATGDAILRAGATPIFVDIDPPTFNMDPPRIRDYLSGSTAQSLRDSNKPVGILPVHLYGQSCKMDEIMAIAKEHNLFVVEDVAQAFGAYCGGKRLGAVGTAGAFSFFPSKNLGGFGDAGMVSTNDSELAQLIRVLLKHGGTDKYNVDHIGYNARMDTIQAAILLAKVKHVDEFNTRRRRLASLYVEGLADVPDIVLPLPFRPLPLNDSSSFVHGLSPIVKDSHVHHQFTIRVLNGNRDCLQNYLKKKGVDSMVYYPFPLHKMKVFKERSKTWGSLEQSEKAVNEVLSLPIEPAQNPNITGYVIQCVTRYFAQE